MRRKPRISRRHDGRWTVRRPVVGFRPNADEAVHTSWSDAVRSLTELAEHYAAGGEFERGRQHADQLAAVPVWTPLEYDDQEGSMASDEKTAHASRHLKKTIQDGGHHIGFGKMEDQPAATGATNPGGLARTTGEQKYGSAGYAGPTVGRPAAVAKRTKKTSS